MLTRSKSRGNNSNIKVVVRIRPDAALEQSDRYENVTEAISDHMLVFDPKISSNSDFLQEKRRGITQRRYKDLKYAFDHVFKPSASNRDIFEDTTQEIISDVLKGYNCSVFAYGATGSGKTHTMLGNDKEPGVIYHTMIRLYQRIAELKEEKNFSVAVSYLEVYNEMVRDLLMPRDNLPIREDKSVGIIITGLSLHKPENADELLSMLRYGNQNRTQHPTDANAESSRSHAVFQVYVKQRPRTTSSYTEISIAKMCLVDLAGSERASKNSNCGARFREGANINRSLLALGNVINALADNKYKAYIPYRDSKLTRLLKDSLGGNCQTIMIATVSPSSHSYEETYNTLRYADRAKLIKADLKKNVMSIDQHIVNYKKYVTDLERENQELRRIKKTFEESSKTSANPQTLSPKVEKYQDRLEDLFKARKSLMKAWVSSEITKRELKWKMSRKERAIRRIEMLTGSKDVVNKHERIIERMKRMFAKEEVSMEKSFDQIRKQDEAILQLVTEIQSSVSDKLSLEILNMNLQMRVSRSHLIDSEAYLGFVRRMARAQERQSVVNERLIQSFIKVVKKQHDVLEREGVSPNDLVSEYHQCCYMVEEKGVSWVQQNSGKKERELTDRIKSPELKQQESDQDFSISEIIDIKMPKISLEALQVNGRKSSVPAGKGAQRVFSKQPVMKSASRASDNKTFNLAKSAPTLRKPVLETSAVKKETDKTVMELSQRNERVSVVQQNELSSSSPTIKDVEIECGSIVKKLVDRYSQNFALQASTNKASDTPINSPAPAAKKRLQWPAEEAKPSTVISSVVSHPPKLDVPCDSPKDNTVSDSLNTTFEIDKPAIPNTPCIDEVSVRDKRQNSVGVQSEVSLSPSRRSKRFSFSKKLHKLNFASEDSNLSPVKTNELNQSHGDQLNSHHLRSRHIPVTNLSSPLAVASDTGVRERKRSRHSPVSNLSAPTAVASETGVRERKRPHSSEGSPHQSKWRSTWLSNLTKSSDLSSSKGSNSHSPSKPIQTSANVNQSCSVYPSTDEACLNDHLATDEQFDAQNPCLASTPDNSIVVAQDAVTAPDYKANPYMLHVINSLKKHGKPSLTATLLPSKEAGPSSDDQRPPLQFLDVNSTKASTTATEKSKLVTVSSSTVNFDPPLKSDLRPLRALDRLKERRHFRSLASKPYAREMNRRTAARSESSWMTRKSDMNKDVPDLARPSYMLPTFATSQRMNGLEQDRPRRTRAVTAPSRQTYLPKCLPWNKS